MTRDMWHVLLYHVLSSMNQLQVVCGETHVFSLCFPLSWFCILLVQIVGICLQFSHLDRSSFDEPYILLQWSQSSRQFDPICQYLYRKETSSASSSFPKASHWTDAMVLAHVSPCITIWFMLISYVSSDGVLTLTWTFLLAQNHRNPHMPLLNSWNLTFVGNHIAEITRVYLFWNSVVHE